jgi:ABC-type phosphate/phosphonate transport system substrate-binding protein
VKRIANARMYSVAPAAAGAWRRLFDWLAERSGVPLDPIDHAYPAPLSDLWSRPDLACVFMCGFPFIRSPNRPKPVAAPVPAGARYGGRPVYVTDLVVRADAPFRALEDTFGGRLGYTVEDSHSGYNALRHHLLQFRSAERPSLYRETVGPFFTPRRILEAILAGDIDVGPVDGYALDLMQRHDPGLATRIRTVATTDAAPMPLLIASANCPDDVVARLRAALALFGEANECAGLAEELCLTKFVPVVEADYDRIAAWDLEARAAGYDRPA